MSVVVYDANSVVLGFGIHCRGSIHEEQVNGIFWEPCFLLGVLPIYRSMKRGRLLTSELGEMKRQDTHLVPAFSFILRISSRIRSISSCVILTCSSSFHPTGAWSLGCCPAFGSHAYGMSAIGWHSIGHAFGFLRLEA